MSTKNEGRRAYKRRLWTPEEDAQLAELFGDHKLVDIAQIMGRPISSLSSRRHFLGLERTPEQQARITDGRFKKGQNRRSGIGRNKKARAPRLKGGRNSNSQRPIGAERTTRDGILIRKVSDTGVRDTDWRPVHVLHWEEVNGPVPDDHFLVSKDGNRANLSPDNWEPVTRAENLNRNRIQRYGPEYQSLAITLGHLKSKIKEVTKCKQ